MTIATRILDYFFDRETISGNGRRPYLHRWVLIRRQTWALYLHHFLASDWSLDLHDHPKDFLSIGLLGEYWEERADGMQIHYRAPWIRGFSAEHRHRLIIEPGKSAWTLVRVGPIVRDWGFWKIAGDEGVVALSRWVPWRQYVYDDPDTDARVAPAFQAIDRGPTP